MTEEHKQIVASLIAARKAYEEQTRPLIDELERLSSGAEVDLRDHANRLPKMARILSAAKLTDAQGHPKSTFWQSEIIHLDIEYASKEPLTGIGFAIYSVSGARVGGFNTYMGLPPPHKIANSGRQVFALPAKQLAPDTFYLNLSVNAHQTKVVDWIEGCLFFTVLSAQESPGAYLCEPGLIQLEGTCEIIPVAQKD